MSVRCFVKDCPLHGKCDLEIKDADACGVYRLSTPKVRKIISNRNGQAIANAKKLDRQKPIVQPWQESFMKEMDKTVKEYPKFLQLAYLESRERAYMTALHYERSQNAG